MFRPTKPAGKVLAEPWVETTSLNANLQLRRNRMHMNVILPTDACCPDINIEDFVLSHKIGEITENTT